METRIRMAAAAFLLLLGASMAQAGDDLSSMTAGDSKESPRFLFELKRQSTDRGTVGETTSTWIKIENFRPGVVSLLRLELPFPDQRTSFEGDPFNPRLGDIKTRVGFRAVPLGGIPLSSFFEVTFPTAQSEELGTGQYQLSPGIWSNIPISLSALGPTDHKVSFEPLIQQVVSVAGDKDRRNINYTKFELSLKDLWRQKYRMKLTAKPVVNWMQNGDTGAVAELEGGWNIHRHWWVDLLFGTRLWGEAVPATYDGRIEIKVSFMF
jgi:hypothetical protein